MDTTDNSSLKDPDEWVTGDEPMTGAQASYLETLAREAGQAAPDDLTKAEASKRIDDLQAVPAGEPTEGRRAFWRKPRARGHAGGPWPPPRPPSSRSPSTG